MYAKPKVYDFEDSNIALLGSAMDKACREAAAATEPAWEKAGKVPGIQIWRIEQFKVKAVSPEDYGTFYAGDAYIILETRKDEEKLVYDLYFWLGRDCSQDEAGTAAYKTVELDDLLGGAPVQHREVMNFEGEPFLALFKPSIKVLDGGVASGFRHVEVKTDYKPRLLRIHSRTVSPRKSAISTFEVPLENKALNHGDVFILDLGLTVYQWQGSKCSASEKRRGSEIANSLNSERKGMVQVNVVEGYEENPDFHALLGGSQADVVSKDTIEEDEKTGGVSIDKKVFKLSDASGELEFEQVSSDSTMETNDAYIVDSGFDCFVWIGKGSSDKERKNAIIYAQKYLASSTNPFKPITRIREGEETVNFKSALAAHV